METTASPASAARFRRPFLRWDTWLVAVLAYVPLLATKRGLLADDTKIYLYLDPGHLLATAASMWNKDIAFGTVTHQNIGYLLPMGPYYWLAKTLDVPLWIAQRFWMGSLLFLAALGVRKCAQELGLTRWAGWAAALPYMLSPFILVNLDRTSAILMPWAGLGWMMLFTIRAARRNDWRNPALFALVVALVGGVNATSILLVGFAPLAYLLFAARTREISWRTCGAVIARISVLSLLVSIWWLAGLWAEGKYGINILRFTESFSTVTFTSSSSEVFRGLGYWYFYGRDALQPWTLNSLSYMTGKVVPTASFVVPIVGFVAALCIRWRYRLFAVAITFLGVVIAVGSYPLDKPTPLGQVFKYLALHTTAALAMRSTNRVIPIMLLGLALLTAAGFDSLRHVKPRVALWGFGVFVAFVLVAMLPLFNGRVISSNLTFPSTLPPYVTSAAHDLSQGDPTSSVLGLPGQDFAYYRFGAANDSIWPAITNRPWVSSQVQLAGEPASINLIRALDSTLQNGVAVPSSIAPIARLFNASNVLVQMNLQYERYDSPLPSYMWNLFNPVPSGLTLEKTYGPNGNFQAINGPFINEAILGLPNGYVFPPQLAIYKVSDPRPLVRTESAASPQIVAGDGEGLVSMATTGLLNNSRAIFFDGSETRAQIKSLAAQPGAWLVLTDSNQKRLDTFGTLSATEGYVEQASENSGANAANEETLPTFTNPPPGAQTVALMDGLTAVSASGYGNIITNNPEDQPYKAVDGNIYTAWEVAAFSPGIGQWFSMTATAPQTITKLQIVQPQSYEQNRYITKIGISIDGGTPIVRTLSFASTLPAGQTVTIPPTVGRTIKITVLDDSDHDQDLTTASGIGFAEVDVAGFGPATRGLLMPTSLLPAAGAAAATDKLSIVTNRLRVATTPPRQDPELNLLRYFDLPYARTFTIAGLANLNPAATDDVINTLVGRHASGGTSVAAAEGSGNLPGSLNDTAWAAFDGNLNTAWLTRFRVGPGQWVQARLTRPVTVSTFKMTVINDGYHSIPTAFTISNGTTSEPFTLPITMATPTGHLNTQETFTINVPAITGSTFRFTVTALKTVTVIDRVAGGPNFPSIGVAEIALPGVTPGVTPTTFDSGCRTDVLSIDGHAIPVRVTGTTADALNQDQLGLATCTPNATVTLSAGMNTISSTAGYLNGINVNNVVLNSSGTNPGPVATIAPKDAHWYGRTVVRATVNASDDGRWVVLAQSFSQGWHAEVGGHDLGPATLIDGASMGWLLPDNLKGTEAISFSWAPQKTILAGLLLSAAAMLLALFMALADRPRRRARAAAGPATELDATPTWSPLHGELTIGPKLLFLAAVIIALFVSFYAVPVMVGVAWLWTRRRNFGRAVAAFSILLIAVGAGITVWATQSAWVRDISWPNHVDYANTAVWIALMCWFIVVVGTSAYGHRAHDAEVPASREEALDADDGAVAVEEVVDAAPEPEEPAPRVQYPSATLRPPAATVAVAATTELGDERVRRRGLNVPDPTDAVGLDGPREVTSIPLGGLSRTLFFLRAGLKSREDPEHWQSILTEDAINQLVGKTPLFNRRVLDLTDAVTTHTDVLVERGAHVTSMRREIPATRRTSTSSGARATPGGDVVFTPTQIPAPDHSFDLVFATNVMSCVPDPATLLDEIVRVTRPGGTIYIQNVMWNSILGGRETSPWHLVSGNLARRRYTRRNGHEPFNRYGLNFFKLKPRRLMKLIHQHQELAVFVAGPRFLPLKWGWTLHVPILRSLVIQDLVVAAERR